MFMFPVPGPVTSPYGWRIRNGRREHHNGFDQAWLRADPEGSRRILAPAYGVIDTGWNKEAGFYVGITVHGGLRIRICHFESVAVENGQAVNQWHFLGVMGESGMAQGVHAHIEVWWQGQRIDPTPYFTIPYSPAPPAPQRKRNNMTTRFVQIGTGGKDFGIGAVCALAGDAGFPGPANFQEYVRTHADGSVNDRAAQEFRVHGPAIPITKAEWDRLKAAYTTGAISGGATPEQIAKVVNDDAAERRSGWK